MTSTTLDRRTRRHVEVAIATSDLFSRRAGGGLPEVDASCIDFDDCVLRGMESEAIAWIKQGNSLDEQVFLIASQESLARFPEVLDSESTLIEKVGTLKGVSGSELANRLSDLLEEVYSPLEVDFGADALKAANGMSIFETTKSANRDPQEIDPVYLKQVLSPEQEDQLLSFLRLPEEESDPSNTGTD